MVRLFNLSVPQRTSHWAMTLPLLLMSLLTLFIKLFVGTPPTSCRASLDGLPADVLGLVFEMLRDLDDTQQPYGHEVYSGACLIPLSETCAP